MGKGAVEIYEEKKKSVTRGRMNTAELLDTVFYLYKKTFWRQIARVVIFAAPAYVLIIAQSFAGAAFLFAPGYVNLVNGPFFITFAASVLLIVWVWASLNLTGNISLASRAYYGEEFSLGQMFNDIKINFLRTLSAVAAVFLLAVPPVSALMFIVYRAFRYLYGVDFTRIPAAFIIIAGVSVIFIYCAATAFSCLTSAAAPSAALGGDWFFSAVVKSIRLIKKDMLKIYGLYHVWRLITAVLYFAALAAYFILTGGAGAIAGAFTGYYAADVSRFIGGNLIYILITLILSPLGGILCTTIFINQKMRRFGLVNELKIRVRRRENNLDVV